MGRVRTGERDGAEVDRTGKEEFGSGVRERTRLEVVVLVVLVNGEKGVGGSGVTVVSLRREEMVIVVVVV